MQSVSVSAVFCWYMHACAICPSSRTSSVVKRSRSVTARFDKHFWKQSLERLAERSHQYAVIVKKRSRVQKISACSGVVWDSLVFHGYVMPWVIAVAVSFAGISAPGPCQNPAHRKSRRHHQWKTYLVSTSAALLGCVHEVR